MGMLVNPSRFGGGSGAAGFLDGLATAPRCCLSLRKLVSTASSAVRVRRSSDSAEQDIGFSGSAVGSGLDTSALAAFVGSNSAFVTTFYDQTGNGFNAVQATAASQPRIVNAGTYDGKLVFDASNDFMKVATLTQGAAQCGVYAKLAQPKTGTKILWETGGNYNSLPKSLVFYTDTGAFTFGMADDGSGTHQRSNNYTFAAATLSQITALYDRSLTGTGEIAAYLAGTLQTATAAGTFEQTTTFTTNYDIYLGARAGTSLFADLNLETWVAYNADTASLRTSIEAIVA